MVKKNRILSFVLIIFAFAALIGLTIKDIVSDVKLGLDLQGGFEVLYEVSPLNEGDQINSNTLASTADALDRRINALGVSEPRIEIEEGNRIRVQLAGVEDQQQARKMLSTTAELTFRDANDKELLNGSDLVEGGAKQAFDQTNRPIVTLQLKDADKFAEATKHVLQQSNNVMVIWLDFNENEDSFAKEITKENPKYISAPAVTEVIRSTEVQITGDFTVEEAQNLANLLNAGSLPVKLTEIYSTSVGAQFGVDALQKTVFAGIIGIAAIFLFMLFYYRLPGLVAVIALTVYIWLILF
jgi:protein-export membrane protein SecD